MQKVLFRILLTTDIDILLITGIKN